MIIIIVFNFVYIWLFKIGEFFLKPVESHPNIELVLIFIIVPTFLDIFQFWVMDNFLMSTEILKETELCRLNLN